MYKVNEALPCTHAYILAPIRSYTNGRQTLARNYSLNHNQMCHLHEFKFEFANRVYRMDIENCERAPERVGVILPTFSQYVFGYKLSEKLRGMRLLQLQQQQKPMTTPTTPPAL